ncbi:MAG: thioredoxin family protein, partial [Planctomycetes bacterium]|nr:thioredoxin family protein [Planctomycetota bacterium]
MKKILVACLLAIIALAPAAAGGSGVFDSRPYAEAKAAAKKEAKWFIVKGTAVWCGPCKQMERTTWKDEKVVAWIEKHAIAVSVDVDQSPDIAKELRIRAMPTIIAIKDGEEFDRVVGMQTPAQFNTWLTGLPEGKKSLDAAVERAGGLDPGAGKVDVRARMTLARELASAGRAEEAAKEYVWLWKNMLKHDRSMYGVRISFMARQMTELASESEAARVLFANLRDESGARVDADSVESAVDWVCLNRALGHEDRTVEWYKKVARDPRWTEVIARIDSDVSDYLARAGRLRELGELCRDPLSRLHHMRLEFEMVQSAMKRSEVGDQQEPSKSGWEQEHREDVAMLYAALLAADREQDAGLFAARARKLDPSEAMTLTLVRRAIKEREPRESHLRWLESFASEEAKELRGRVAIAW